jgi:hypothetical protein
MTLLRVKQLQGPAGGNSGAVITFDSGSAQWSNDLSTAIAIPQGDSNARPSTPSNGSLRFNSDTLHLETASEGNWQSLAFLDSPVFTGIPTAPTATDFDSSNQLATTEFVATAITNVRAGVTSVVNLSGDITLAQLVAAGVAPLFSKVIVVTASSYNCLLTDQYVVVKRNPAGSTAITLPTTPITGQRINVKDGTGLVPDDTITLTPSSGTIDGAASYSMDQPWQAITLLYDGADWNIV